MNELDPKYWPRESGHNTFEQAAQVASVEAGSAPVRETRREAAGAVNDRMDDTTDEMSRAFDPKNLDARSPAMPAGGPVRRSVPSHPVCPFCGTINETATAPCRQCAMENTQATRAATRAKLGPWYVWQTKNPAAPGMNFATLMSLVQRGRITPRSIVRGPTTHQLWRYAARVKGLSREFGACWGCGAEVAKTAKVCVGCKRLQQPPINPDTLLEAGEPASVGVTGAAPAVADPGNESAESHLPLGMAAESPLELYSGRSRPDAPAAAPMAQPQLRGTAPQRAVVRTPMDPARIASLPVVDMGDQPLASGMELAAFELPRNDAASRSSGRRVFKGIFIAFLIAAASVAVTLYMNPNLSPQYSGWIHGAVDKIKGIFQSTGSTNRPSGDGNPVAPQADGTSGGSVNAPSPSVKPPAVTPTSNSIDPHATKPSVTLPAPKAPVPNRSSIEVQFGPGPNVTTPSVTSQPGTNTRVVSSDPTAVDVSRSTVDGSDMPPVEKKAWDLRSTAIIAEQQGDYATAVKNYEAIQKLPLPENSGPTDVQERLTRARTLFNNGEK